MKSVDEVPYIRVNGPRRLGQRHDVVSRAGYPLRTRVSGMGQDEVQIRVAD